MKVGSLSNNKRSKEEEGEKKMVKEKELLRAEQHSHMSSLVKIFVEFQRKTTQLQFKMHALQGFRESGTFSCVFF